MAEYRRTWGRAHGNFPGGQRSGREAQEQGEDGRGGAAQERRGGLRIDDLVDADPERRGAGWDGEEALRVRLERARERVVQRKGGGGAPP